MRTITKEARSIEVGDRLVLPGQPALADGMPDLRARQVVTRVEERAPFVPGGLGMVHAWTEEQDVLGVTITANAFVEVEAEDDAEPS